MYHKLSFGNLYTLMPKTIPQATGKQLCQNTLLAFRANVSLVYFLIETIMIYKATL